MLFRTNQSIFLVGHPQPYMAPIYSSYGGVKVKMKYMLQIYIVPLVDWYQN